MFNTINFYELAEEDPRHSEKKTTADCYQCRLNVFGTPRSSTKRQGRGGEGVREKRRKLLLIYHDGSLGLELLVVISAEPSFSRPPNEFLPPLRTPSRPSCSSAADGRTSYFIHKGPRDSARRWRVFDIMFRQLLNVYTHAKQTARDHTHDGWKMLPNGHR